MKTNFNMGSSCPIAYVAKNKQRLKQYGNVVYLKNGDEFEVELYNPTQNKVLAKILINNKSIGPGIILRPGERIFLERYVLEAKKFLFETYTVNGGSDEVKKAIETNGDVVVKFYKEEEITQSTFYDNIITTTYPYDFYGTCGNNTLTLDNLNFNSNNAYNSQNIGSVASGCASHAEGHSTHSSHTYTTTSCSGELSRGIVGEEPKERSFLSKKSLSKSIETGRVEKGSYSDQTMQKDYTKFSNICIGTSEWKLLPESRKNVTIDDLVQYCSSCGRKKRKSERYCPTCGYKF
jgi:hypothetical protein